MRIAHLLAAATLAAVAAGCATVAPGETEDQVVAKLGQPTHRYRDGTDHLLEYAYGPSGQYTYMARIGPDGRLVSYEQVLTTQKFATLKLGQATKEDVLKAVGAPSETSYLPRRDLEVWSYPYKEAGAWNSIMNIHFDRAGIVRELVNTPDLRYEPDGLFSFGLFGR